MTNLHTRPDNPASLGPMAVKARPLNDSRRSPGYIDCLESRAVHPTTASGRMGIIVTIIQGMFTLIFRMVA